MTISRHNIISIIFSVGFVVLVQLFAAPIPVFRYLLPCVALFVLALQVYNYYYLKSLGKSSRWVIVRSMLFYFGLFGIFVLLPNFALRGMFLLATLPIAYFLESFIGNFGEHVLFNEIIVIAFGCFVTLIGLGEYFKPNTTLLLGMWFVLTALLVRSSFEFLPVTSRVKLAASVILALLITQIAWALSFWPLHYSALALIVFNLFYLCWSLVYYFYVHKLSPKRLQFHVMFALLFIIFITLITPWRVLG